MRATSSDPLPDPLAVDGEWLRRLVRGGASWALAGRAAAVLLGFLIHALMARFAVRQDYGAYLIVFGVVLTASAVTSLGLKPVMLREVAVRHGDHLAQIAVARRCLGIVAVSLVVLLSAAGLGMRFLSQTAGLNDVASATRWFTLARTLEAATLVWIVAVTFRDLVAELFRAHHGIRDAIIVGLVGPAILQLVVVGLAILTFKRQLSVGELVWCAALSQLAIALGGLLFALPRWSYTVAGKLRMPSREPLGIPGPWQLLVGAFPLLLSDISGMVTAHAATFVLAWGAGSEAVAWLGAASRIAAVVSLSLLITNGFMPPLIAQLYNRGDMVRLGQVVRGVAGAAFVPAVAAAGVFMAAPQLVLGIVYGQSYSGAGAMLIILAFANLLSALAGPCGVVCTQTNHARWTLVSNLAGGAVTLLLSIALVRKHGAFGVALAMAAGLFVRTTVATGLAWLRVGVVTISWIPDTVRMLKRGH